MDVLPVLAGAMILLGLVGIVVPVLPGLLLVWGGVGLWALSQDGATPWIVFAAATGLMVAGSAAKYLLPGRRLRASGVPWTSLALGGLLGVIGFFVIPVVGIVLGFLLGVYLAERLRLRDHRAAWPSTRAALAATGWSILIELFTGLLMTGAWILGVLLA